MFAKLLKFLGTGDKVKVTMRFRGREMAHIELGQQKLDLMAEVLEDAATIEQRPRLEGRSMSMVLMPK